MASEFEASAAHLPRDPAPRVPIALDFSFELSTLLLLGPGGTAPLTSLEFRILCTLMRTEAIRLDELAHQVWAHSHTESTDAYRQALKRVRRKLRTVGSEVKIVTRGAEVAFAPSN